MGEPQQSVNIHEEDLMQRLTDSYVITTVDELKARCRRSPHILLAGVLLSLNWGLSGAFLVAPAYISSPDEINVANFTTVNQLEGGKSAFNVISSSFSLGNLLFAPVFGWASDKWGRRPLVVLSVIATGLSGVLCAIAPNLQALLAFRFLQGVFYSPSTLINWVLLAETVPKKSHGAWAFCFGLSWVVGSSMVALAVTVCYSWRQLLMVLSLPSIFLGLLLYWYIQESLDYLLMNDYHDSVHDFIRRHLPAEYRVDLEALTRNSTKLHRKQRQIESWNLITEHKKLLLVLFSSCYMSFAYTLVHNAMSLTSTVIQFGNIHVNFVLSSLVELPSYAIVPILFHWTGEKGTLCIFHILTSISGVAIYLIPTDHWFYLLTWLLTKFASSSAFMCVLVFMSSKYPIEYRNSCVALSATFGNLAAVFAPQVYVLESYIQGGMFLLFSACTGVAVLLTYILPNKA